MNDIFNSIVVSILNEFIINKNLSCQESAQIRKYTFSEKIPNTPSQHLSVQCLSHLKKYNIFEPISHFVYGKGTLYLIEFKHPLNIELFTIFFDKFINTEFEELFFSCITKIIPINYCTENQPWAVVKKFLTIPQRKSNGLPDTTNTQRFFHNLTSYAKENDFKQSLKVFCQNNKSLIKRIESQQCLITLTKSISAQHEFKQFIYFNENAPLFQCENDFTSYYFDKNVLFSHYSHLVISKSQPVEKLNDIVLYLNSSPLAHHYIDQIFIHKKETEHKNILILVSFLKQPDYSFPDYILFLLHMALKDNIIIKRDLEKINNFFFLEQKLLTKKNDQKPLKI